MKYQRLDATGLYYYGARYYDAVIGRFISADNIISNPANPQCFNRYSYCLNNPLKYTDPSGQSILDIFPAVTKILKLIVPIVAAVITGIKIIEDVVEEATETIYEPIEEDDPEIVEASGAAVAVVGGTAIVAPEILIVAAIVVIGVLIYNAIAEDDEPDIEYPGDDPTKAPEGYEWRGKPGSKPGDPDGSYYNPKTGEVLSPDFKHRPPVGPHWDYKDPNGNWWRKYPDGTIVPK